MINHLFQLTGPGRFRVKFEDVDISDGVVVRPVYLSICAADQRYYTGQRGQEILRRKLPMALIHEAAGEVVFDNDGIFKPGDRVFLVPNLPSAKDDYIAENYLYSSKFRASSLDGFMQEFVKMPHDRLVSCEGIIPEIASFGELLSVAMHAVNTFLSKSHGRRETIGIWGDGNLGYSVALLLRILLPQARLVILGITPSKLEYFTFADEVINLALDKRAIQVDHAFECVGGGGCEPAIDNIIGYIVPEGTLMLMGVSENKVPVNTRMVLEKGLTLIGRSRSGRADFENIAEVLRARPEVQQRLIQMVSQVVRVTSMADMNRAFDTDLTVPFKTVMDWRI